MNTFVSSDSTVTLTKNGVFHTTLGNLVTFVRYKRLACVDGYSPDHSLFQRDSKAIVLKDATGATLVAIDKTDFQDFDALSNAILAGWKAFWS